VTKFCLWLDIQYIIVYATFGDDRSRDLGVARGRISHVPIDLRRHPYNTLALGCECVIRHAPIPTVWASDSPMFWTYLPVPPDEPYRLRQTTYTLFTFSTQTDEQTDRQILPR